VTVRAATELWVQTVDPHGWDAAVWDTDVWETAVEWVDVSCDWQGSTVVAGRNGPLDRYRAAHATIRLDNRTGDYNSWSDATPWAPPGSRHLGAGTLVRVGIDIDGHPRRHLFTGVADTWVHRRAEPDRWVELGCDDPLATLTLADLPEQPAQGAGETAGPRLQRILDANGLSSMPTRFDPGVVGLQATTLADDAWSLACLTADSDGGWLWADGDGTLVYYQGDRDLTDPRWTAPVIVIGDDDRIAGALCWDQSPVLADNRDAVINHAAVATTGGTAHYADDTPSQSRYQVRTFQRFDLIHQPDTWSQTLADKIVRRMATGGTRPDSVALTAHTDAEAWTLINLLWHDRVRVVVHDVGDVYAADSFIDAYQWNLTAVGADREVRLNVVLTLSPAVFLPPAARWDTAVWDTDEWGY
jgi:hypothetical protein